MNPADVDGRSRQDVLRSLTTAFAAAGLDTPDLDARLLLAYALNVDALQIVTARDERIDTKAAVRLSNFAQRRLTHEPVARIVGERWFYGRPFTVTPATLDPRSDSETLIDAALGLVRTMSIANTDLHVLDIGTGTGCLLLTLLAELPGATGIGVDISAEALAVASANAQRLGIRDVTWRCGSFFSPVQGETFNIILSNPPYIPTGDLAGLAPDVRSFDPRLALDGGGDGLDAYRHFTKHVFDYISNGYIIFEVGLGQADDVIALLRNGSACRNLEVHTYLDLGGVRRCVAASARASN